MKHIPNSIKDKYEILGVIGEGSYGVVLKARKKDTNTTVAIKHFKQVPGHTTDMDIIDRELNILQSLRFENVVELIEWFREKKQCFLVFEYVEWNMLQVLQNHSDGLPLEQVRQLSYQLFRAIYWCHAHEIIHRDIKPENLLISTNFTLKLCDFGFARFCNTQVSTDYYTDYVATRWYRSPELLIGSSYGKPVDIWACGCIMAELSTGQALFAGESDIDQLYRIQKCLGPLPSKYIEVMRSNPKFEGLKFPPIHQLDTLDRRYGHVFPPDMMELFKGTLRLHASDRLTTEACVQSQAFMSINRKQKDERLKRKQPRPKTVLESFTSPSSQYNLNSEVADSRLSKRYDGDNDTQLRHRSSTFLPNNHDAESMIDASMTASSLLLAQQPRYRSNTQMSDRLSTSHSHRPPVKLVRALSRNLSSSSDEQGRSVAASPMSSSDDESDRNNVLSHHNRLRRKYVKGHPTSSMGQAPTVSPTLRFASNGVPLRPKHPYHQQGQKPDPALLLHRSSKDMERIYKRFSSDAAENRSQQPQPGFSHQQMPEPKNYRSSMAIVPSLNANVCSVQMSNNLTRHLSSSSSSLSKQQATPHYHREKTNDEYRQPPTKRDVARSRASDYYVFSVPSVETTPSLKRAPSRQTTVMHHQVVPDTMDHADMESMVSNTHSTSFNVEPQLNNNNTSRSSWNFESRRSLYASDSHLMNPGAFTRPLFVQYSSTKVDPTYVNKAMMASHRDSSHDLSKSAKVSSRQSIPVIPKTPLESSRTKQSRTSHVGIYPSARTAILHLANALIPTSQQRQQSSRLPKTKTRHHDC